MAYVNNQGKKMVKPFGPEFHFDLQHVYHLKGLNFVFSNLVSFFPPFGNLQASDEVRSRDVEVATTEQEDHHTAADNQGVVMNEIEPSVSERRPSSDTSGTHCF